MIAEEIHGLLLAAGASSRFGGQKLLHKLPDGESIIKKSATTLIQVLPECSAVVASDADAIAEFLADLGYSLIFNSEAHCGIGSSIQCGIRKSLARAWIITLADMPFIQTETIASCVQYLCAGEKLVAASYQGKRGHPVGIHHDYKTQLLSLPADVGAKQIINANLAHLRMFSTQDKGVVWDIDTSDDIEKWV